MANEPRRAAAYAAVVNLGVLLLWLLGGIVQAEEPAGGRTFSNLELEQGIQVASGALSEEPQDMAEALSWEPCDVGQTEVVPVRQSFEERYVEASSILTGDIDFYV